MLYVLTLITGSTMLAIVIIVCIGVIQGIRGK